MLQQRCSAARQINKYKLKEKKLGRNSKEEPQAWKGIRGRKRQCPGEGLLGMIDWSPFMSLQATDKEWYFLM